MKTISKFFLASCFSVLASFPTVAQKNLTLLSTVSFPATVAGVWHYARDGREYALVGTNNGISIVDVTVPTLPVILFNLPGDTSLWHEVKATGDYAYAVSEGTNGALVGLQVINLNYLPDSAPYHFWQGDSIIAGKLAGAHTVTATDGYVYINGNHITSPNLNGGVIIASLSDPWNPHFVGAETDAYCHDSYVRGDTMFASEIFLNPGQFAVYDISNRANPKLLQTQETPGQFNHTTWLSDNGKYLFTTDEKSGTPMGSFDISNLQNITLVDTYYPINMRPAEPHNVRVLNDFCVVSCYGSQVTIVDAAHPDNLIEVGNYPTGTNSLCWDADPFLPSGIILATDTYSQLLYIFQPTYVRACYLEGMVTDSTHGQTLFKAHVDFLSINVHDSTDLTGHYKTGYPDSGTYQIQYSANCYITKTITQTLSNGVLSTVNVQLVPCTAGLTENNTEPLVKILNNPSDNIVIEISEDALKSEGKINLILTDELGRVVYRKFPVTESLIYLNKNSLSAGTYYFSLQNNDNVIGRGKVVFISN